MYHKVEADIDGRRITIESGRLARQANGSVLVTCGETAVLVTATAARKAKPDINFLPLTIEYQERLSAVGKIPGSFFRREIGRPTDKEVLTCRIIDRPLRPLFPKGYGNETQVIATVLSCDQQNEPDTLAMVGASAALLISDIPYTVPIAGLRVGCIDGHFVFNPTKDELAKSTLDLVVAGSSKAVVMVEGSVATQPEDTVLDAIYAAHARLQTLIGLQEELKDKLGKSKWTVNKAEVDPDLVARVDELAREDMRTVISTADKMQRSALFDSLAQKVSSALADQPETAKARDVLSDLKKKMMRQRIVKDSIRIDGRRFDEVRPISCEVGCLPRTHGSALFTRGETQVIVAATLGGDRDQQRVENLYGETHKQFMLHYNFPPFCVGEVRPLRGPSRRDIGHGTLAERGISAVLPPADKFPYVIRIVSDVLESNGSSSMATVCGSCLALMDGGIPVKAHVSGIAMGLIKEEEQVVVLSDILGDEDHLGDMDFKVVGTEEGITALQMDIKIEGVSRQIMSQALGQAKAGRLHIIEIMRRAMPEPRGQVSSFAPKYTEITISPDKIRDIIGPSGKVIKAMSQEFSATIEVNDSGLVRLFTPNERAQEGLVARIRALTAVPEIGAVYDGVVKAVKDFGAFVEIMPGTEGLVHISELDTMRVAKVTDIVREGDSIQVKVLDIDPSSGKIRLSRRALLAARNA